MLFQAQNTSNFAISEATKLIIVIFSVEFSKIMGSVNAMRMMQKYYREDAFSGPKDLKCCDFGSYDAHFSYFFCKIFQKILQSISAMTLMQKLYQKDDVSGLKHLIFLDFSCYNGYFCYYFRMTFRNNTI